MSCGRSRRTETRLADSGVTVLFVQQLVAAPAGQDHQLGGGLGLKPDSDPVTAARFFLDLTGFQLHRLENSVILAKSSVENVQVVIVFIKNTSFLW